MRVSYHPGYYVELPVTHPFPMGKYHHLQRVHARGYLDKLAAGALSATPARNAQLHANTFIEAAGVASRRSPWLPAARVSGGMPA